MRAQCKASEESGGNAVNQSDQVQITEADIVMLLFKLGFKPHIKGYRYTITALQLILECPDLISQTTKVLYPDVAKVHNTKAPRVERAIRHSIEKMWDEDDILAYNKTARTLFQYCSSKPTNAEFLGMLPEALRLKLV